MGHRKKGSGIRFLVCGCNALHMNLRQNLSVLYGSSLVGLAPIESGNGIAYLERKFSFPSSQLSSSFFQTPGFVVVDQILLGTFDQIGALNVVGRIVSADLQLNHI